MENSYSTRTFNIDNKRSNNYKGSYNKTYTNSDYNKNVTNHYKSNVVDKSLDVLNKSIDLLNEVNKTHEKALDLLREVNMSQDATIKMQQKLIVTLIEKVNK